MKKYTLLCLFVIGLTASLQAQSLSFDEALSQMRSGNQKLKGIEKQTEAADYNRKSFRGAILAPIECQCELYAPRRPSLPQLQRL